MNELNNNCFTLIVVILVLWTILTISGCKTVLDSSGQERIGSPLEDQRQEALHLQSRCLLDSVQCK